MTQNFEIAKYLRDIGAKQIVGVLGSGDSFEIVESFIRAGGEFLESPTEFSSPIIASAMNKLSCNQNRAVSISIRGPGLVSSLPGLYHNYIEDLKSLSISEGLSKNDSNYNHHKAFDADSALSSTGLVKDNRDFFPPVLELTSPLNFDHKNKMVHFITRSDELYTYNQSIDEMCSDQSDDMRLKHKKKIFVFGKRGTEFLETHNISINKVPYFLTPAALPFADLNSSNFLGVWTGNEQFKPYFLESKFLLETVVVRVGVMKRELLTLRKSLSHYDVPNLPKDSNINLAEFFEEFGATEFEKEKNYLVSFREKVARSNDAWSVYSVISVINNLKIDLNYSFDVGSYATIIENYIRPVKIRRLHSTFIGKFMGTAIPISIGISLAEPTIPVLCMLGEGSLASSFNEVLSIANLQLPVCILVFSDGSMHSIVGSKIFSENIKGRFLPSNYEALEKVKIPNLPTYFANSIKQFTSAISKWDMKSPMMVFLKFDPSAYAKGVELLR
jgi:hypothetical protein